MHSIPRESIPARCRSDHLYLLVGLNPLPNYPGARLLSKPDGRLQPIHSFLAADYRDRSTQAEVEGKETPPDAMLKSAQPESAEALRLGLYVQGAVKEVQHNGLEVDLGVATVWLARENINPRNLSADELAERFPEGTIMRGWMLAPNKKGRQRMSQWEPKGGAGSGA